MMALLLSTTPAAAEIVQSSDAGFVVHLTGEAATDRLSTWNVLIAPGEWWSDEHTYSGRAANMYLDAQGSGCFCELLDAPKGTPEGTRRGSIEHMHVVYAMPGTTLRMKGGLGPLQPEAVEGVLTITLKNREGGGTLIDWTYVVGGYSRHSLAEMAPLVDRVLGEQVTRLVARLDAGDAKTVPQDEDSAAKDEPKPVMRKAD
jgi:hypothetical protein